METYTSIFRTQSVRYFLTTYISLLLIWKIFLALALSDISAVVPLSLQFFVIFLITIESAYAKKVLQAWVIIFVLLAQTIKIVAKLLASASGELEYITSYTFAFNIFQFFMGLVMLYLARVMMK